MSPATAASTAATEGALRDRCRARSRAAIRRVVGRWPPSRPTPARMTGTRKSVPRMSTTAPMVTANSPPVSMPSRVATLGRPAAPVEPRTTRAPSTVSTTPAARITRLGRGETLWPRMTPTMSSRPRRRAGASAATSVLATAQRAMPASRPHRRSRGADGAVPSFQPIAPMTAGVASTPRTVPATADALPSTRAWASTVRRNTGVLAPLLAARARVRRWRVALTAKAGPTSSAVMMSSMAAPRPRSSRIWLASPDVTSRRSAGSWSSEGGSRRTAAEVTRRPYSLSAWTSCQVTGSLPRTIQPLPPADAPAGGTGTTMASFPL